MLEDAKGFCRFKAYWQLPMPKAALAAHVARRTLIPTLARRSAAA